MVDLELPLLPGLEARQVLIELRLVLGVAGHDHRPLRGQKPLRLELAAFPFDDDVVSLGRSPALDGHVLGRFLPELVQGPLDLGLLHRGLDLLEFELAVFGQLELGPGLDDRLEPEELALLELDVMEDGDGDRMEAVFLQALPQGGRRQLIQKRAPELLGKHPLDHVPGGVTGPESGDLDSAAVALDDLVERRADRFGGQLDL